MIKDLEWEWFRRRNEKAGRTAPEKYYFGRFGALVANCSSWGLAGSALWALA